MGKPKTQRTEALHNAARRYTVAKQVEQAIEQHNFDRLIKAGVIVRGIEALNKDKHRVFDEAIRESMLKKDEGGQGRWGRGRLIVPTNP